MKKSLLLLSLFALVRSIHGQCDLAIVGWNADFPNQILMKAIANIPPNTTYYITDNEWDGSSFNTGELINTIFTNSTFTLLAGSTIILEGVTPPPQCWAAFGTGVTDLSVNGDEIYITKVNPVGTVSSSNICFGVSFGATGGGGGILPTNAIKTSLNNGVYNGSGDITNSANWTFSDNHITLPNAICSFSLPVKLIAFSIYLNRNDIVLNWQTASEINNSHFDVEHSTDGINFEVIGSVEGHGTSTQKQDYTFKHFDLSDGMHYYRLTQIDYDGRSETFEVKSVQLGGKNKFRVFPSETSDLIHIENPSDEAIALYDINGKLLFSGKNQNKIDVSQLASGIYFIKSQQEVVKFRKI